MSCKSIQAITYDLCENNLGGIVAIYLANADEVEGSTPSSGNTGVTDGVITAITMSGTSKFYKFDIKKNTSNFTSTLTVNDNGSSYVSTVLSFLLPRMDASKRAAMNAFMLAECVAIVKDSNGKYWLIGDKDNPLTSTAGTGETGTAKGDANQYTVELTAETMDYPAEVQNTVITTDIVDRV